MTQNAETRVEILVRPDQDTVQHFILSALRPPMKTARVPEDQDSDGGRAVGLNIHSVIDGKRDRR